MPKAWLKYSNKIITNTYKFVMDAMIAVKKSTHNEEKHIFLI